jgi:hypothetical protein
MHGFESKPTYFHVISSIRKGTEILRTVGLLLENRGLIVSLSLLEKEERAHWMNIKVGSGRNKEEKMK